MSEESNFTTTLAMDSSKVDRSTATDLAYLADTIFLDRKTQPQVRNALRKKLSVVRQEKQALEEVITSKNGEIDELKKSIQSLTELINSTEFGELKQISTTTNERVSELKKKNRELRIELDNTKFKNTKLESDIRLMEAEVKRLESISKRPSESAMEHLQVKFNQTKQKLFDSLNQNIELKNHLKLAQKCIQQEIGENVNLNLLASAGTSWRGRAQQILTMQTKIDELKAQLENVRSEYGLSDDFPDEPPVRREQLNHRNEVDSLKRQIASLTTHIDELNHKISALKARNTNIVADVAKFKEKCANLERSSQTADETIASLKERIDIQKFHYENRLAEVQKQSTDAQKQRTDFGFQFEELQVKLENLQDELASKDSKIAEKNETIKKLERDLKNVCGDYLFECRDFRKEEFMGIVEALESEKNNLLDLNNTMNQRLEAERLKIIDLVNQLSKQKIKICRLEGKLRDLERELESQNEKKKRSQRIFDYASNINSTTSILPSFVFENSSHSDIPGQNLEDQPKTYELEELKNKLEISNEKIQILEDKLNYLNEEKQSDSRTFENIIKMSKTVLLDTIHQIKKTSSTDLK